MCWGHWNHEELAADTFFSFNLYAALRSSFIHHENGTLIQVRTDAVNYVFQNKSNMNC